MNDKVVFASGLIGESESIEKAASDPAYDPQLVLYRDWIYDVAGNPTHNFWEAAPSPSHPDGYESLTLPFVIDPNIPHTLGARYTIARHRDIARMTVRLRMQPIGYDVIDELVEAGDLDPSAIDPVPTFTLHGASVEWRPESPESLRSLLPDTLTCPSR